MKKVRLLIFLIIPLLMAGGRLKAQEWNEVSKIIASDDKTVEQGGYGISISADGDYAVVGSLSYLTAYVLKIGTDGIWKELQILTPIVPPPGRILFGTKVYIKGDYIFVQARFIGTRNKVYIYHRNSDDSWVQTQVFESDYDYYDFGSSFSVSGKYALIGDSQEKKDGYAGAVYIYELNSGIWTKIKRLTAPTIGGNDNFGYSASIEGDDIIVGAWGQSDGYVFSQAGAVYVFKRMGSTWNSTPSQIITEEVRGYNYRFGQSIAVEGKIMVIGSSNSLGSGAAYVYEKNASGIWVQKQRLVPSSPEEKSNFGNSIAINNGRIIVGQSGSDQITCQECSFRARGAAYIFNLTGNGIWQQQQMLTPSDGGYDNGFGTSIAITGCYVLIGAPHNIADGNRGAVFTYSRECCPNPSAITVSASTSATNYIDELSEFTITVTNHSYYKIPAGATIVTTNNSAMLQPDGMKYYLPGDIEITNWNDVVWPHNQESLVITAKGTYTGTTPDPQFIQSFTLSEPTCSLSFNFNTEFSLKYRCPQPNEVITTVSNADQPIIINQPTTFNILLTNNSTESFPYDAYISVVNNTSYISGGGVRYFLPDNTEVFEGEWSNVIWPVNGESLTIRAEVIYTGIPEEAHQMFEFTTTECQISRDFGTAIQVEPGCPTSADVTVDVTTPSHAYVGGMAAYIISVTNNSGAVIPNDAVISIDNNSGILYGNNLTYYLPNGDPVAADWSNVTWPVNGQTLEIRAYGTYMRNKGSIQQNFLFESVTCSLSEEFGSNPFNLVMGCPGNFSGITLPCDGGNFTNRTSALTFHNTLYDVTSITLNMRPSANNLSINGATLSPAVLAAIPGATFTVSSPNADRSIDITINFNGAKMDIGGSNQDGDFVLAHNTMLITLDYDAGYNDVCFETIDVASNTFTLEDNTTRTYMIDPVIVVYHGCGCNEGMTGGIVVNNLPLTATSTTTFVQAVDADPELNHIWTVNGRMVGSIQNEIELTPVMLGGTSVEIEHVVMNLTTGAALREVFSYPVFNIPNTFSESEICSGKSIQIPYTVQGTYNAGNVFTAQLSDAAGDFSNSVTIGTLTGTTAGSINAFIPGSTPAGTGYRVRVVSSDPAIIGTNNGSDISVQPFTTLLDMDFNPQPWNSGITQAFALDKVNGMAYVGRALQTQASGNIASFNIETGAVNTAFVTGTGFNHDISAIAYHPSGKIIVGGRFTTYKGVSTPYLACLNPDGSLDNVFHTNIGTGPNGQVRAIAIESDGSIVIGGNFSSFNGSVCRFYRLNVDGTSGTAIASGGISGTNFIKKIIPFNGNLLVCGNFAKGIKLLNSSGVAVPAFTIGSGPGGGGISDIALNHDETFIIVGGQFSTFNGQARSCLAKLNAVTGALDMTFNPATPSFGYPNGKGKVSAVGVHSDGRVFVGRDYWTQTSSTVEALSVLDPITGALHQSNSLMKSIAGYPLQVLVIEMMDDGKILVGGAFSNYGGVGRKSVLKLLPSPDCGAVGGARTGGAYEEYFTEESLQSETNEPLVYPNPTANTVNIKYASVSSISIMNIQGQTVLTAPEQDLTEGVELQVQNLPPGIYFVKISTASDSDKVSKLIIVK